MMPIGAEVKIRKDLKLGVLYKNRNNKRAMHACRGMLLLAGKKAFITNNVNNIYSIDNSFYYWTDGMFETEQNKKKMI